MMNVSRESKLQSCTGHQLHCSYWYPENDQPPRYCANFADNNWLNFDKTTVRQLSVTSLCKISKENSGKPRTEPIFPRFKNFGNRGKSGPLARVIATLPLILFFFHRAAVFLSHGFGEYLVTYDRVLQFLLKAKLLVFGHDHVGFGRSGGKRAQIDSIDQYCKDVECHVACVKAKLNGIPMFIVGHSMGGVIAVSTGLQYPDLFDGVVLLSPGLAIDKKFNNPTIRFLGQTLAKVAPGAGLIQLKADDITSDPSIIEKYIKDPLIYKGKLKARWLNAFRVAVDKVNVDMHLVRWPFLCIAAGSDPWIPAVEIKRIMELAASPDKTIVIVPNALHRVHDEPNGVGDDVCRQVVQWIEKHIP